MASALYAYRRERHHLTLTASYQLVVNGERETARTDFCFVIVAANDRLAPDTVTAMGLIDCDGRSFNFLRDPEGPLGLGGFARAQFPAEQVGFAIQSLNETRPIKVFADTVLSKHYEIDLPERVAWPPGAFPLE